jgi:hypothetical protein
MVPLGLACGITVVAGCPQGRRSASRSSLRRTVRLPVRTGATVILAQRGGARQNRMTRLGRGGGARVECARPNPADTGYGYCQSGGRSRRRFFSGSPALGDRCKESCIFDICAHDCQDSRDGIDHLLRYGPIDVGVAGSFKSSFADRYGSRDGKPRRGGDGVPPADLAG